MTTTVERGVLQAIAELLGSDEDYAVATVVRVRGSAYRRPGARLVVTRDRLVAGGVSAGCLEATIRHKAWWWLGDAAATVVTFDASADPADGAVGSGCGGVIDVLVERGDRAAGALGAIARCDRAQARGGIATAIAGPHLGARACVEPGYVVADRALPPRLRAAMVAAADRAREPGAATAVQVLEGTDVLVEALVPRPRLFVLGTHADAAPVARLAHQLGWDVTVGATSGLPELAARFAGIADRVVVGAAAIGALLARSDRAAVVVMSHDYAADRAYLAVALDSRAHYIGALGPRARTARMLDELARPGDARLHAPAGLALGADTPETIALAIVAEAQAALAGVRVESLRARADRAAAAEAAQCADASAA